MGGGSKDEEVGMLVRDPFQANDWGFRQFALLVLIFQAIVLLLMVLDGHGLVPLHLRGLLAFLFYSYVPGLVLLRVLRMHRLGGAMTTLLSVAASVSIMMFSGFIMNLVYLELHGPLPFTQPAVAFGQTLTLLTLLGLAFITDRHYEDRSRRDLSPFLTAPAFALYSLPLIAVLSTYLLNGWNIAWLQVALLLLVSAAVLSLAIMRVPSQLYPLAVVCIALAVLFHNSLVSRFVVEWADISFEYWSANWVLLDGFWTMESINRTDSVLSVTVLAPMYALLTGQGLDMVFKACYPILLTMVPLAVFVIARPRIGPKGAFFSAFLIILSSVFFTELLGLARQIVAELLLVTVVALLLHRTVVPINRTLLAWLLALGMIVSHYGVVVIIMPAVLISAMVFFLLERRSMTRGILMKMVGSVVLLIIPPVIWYGNISGSLILDLMRRIVDNLIEDSHSIGLFEELPLILSLQASPHLWTVYLLMFATTALCMFGLYKLRSSDEASDKDFRHYIAVAVPFLIYTLLILTDTYLFDAISRERFFHLCLLFTGPLAIYGSMRAYASIKGSQSVAKMTRPSLAVLGTILVTLFLANAGVFGMAIGTSTVGLDMNKLNVPRHNDGAFLAANFTVEKGMTADRMFADAHRAYLIDMLGGRYDPIYGIEVPPINRETNVHYLLCSENLGGSIWLENPDRLRVSKTYVPMGEKFSRGLMEMDQVYSSQEAELYYRKF